jgi:hypothetical protein
MFAGGISIQPKIESAGHIVERYASCLHLLASPNCYLVMAPTSADMVDNMVMRYVRLPSSTMEIWSSRCFSKRRPTSTHKVGATETRRRLFFTCRP